MEMQSRLLTGSLNALLVMEAAVRHRGFSLAAKELNLSQPAVSRHIATLEGRLGCALFHRDHNKITPTEAGQKLADAVALGIGHVASVWQEVMAQGEDHGVVLACSYGFSDQWLMPRFSDLRRAMGGVPVRLITSDQLEYLDFRRIDAAVVWDVSQLSDRPYFPLIKDETFPVCSPSFLARYHQKQRERGEPEGKIDFSNLVADDFLHFAVGNSGFLTWRSYFTHLGLPIPDFGPTTPYDAYPFLIRAVRSGEGVALGWRGLVDDLLHRNEILRVGPSASNRETSYYLQHRPVSDRTSAVARLVDWFAQRAGELA
ncbi:Glycine cleavage system transcriptional activator [Roseovarius albus]|uniref:Glycine cleavage system transcriptional activator n=1 Tax=Roseovarius albus TaxID=1247867 RepID=A0A1X6ZWS9_9RHOB|nr:LysR family transcriptional regulator [Roseovarius albus]SLN63539.1 Glycine cleavage system transcriptional activator [Roseovarius albus]